MRHSAWKAAITVVALLDIATINVQGTDLRGLSPELLQKLAGAATFVCDSGTKTFPLERLNDNYCDCDDGSDEPGTAACSHTSASFHCANTGYFAKNLPTSRVNDQICDCCDGSDEYGSGAACPSTCATLMEKFMREKRGLLDLYEQGRSEREKLVAEAAVLWTQDNEQLRKLETEVEELTRSVSHLEKLKSDEELAETKEKMENAKDVKRAMLRSLGLAELSHEQLGFLVLELANTMYDKDDLLRFIKAERDGMSESPLETEETEWKERDEIRGQEEKRMRDERAKAKQEQERLREEAIARGETAPAEEEDADEELVVPPVEDRPVKKLFDQMATFTSYVREQARTARESYYASSSSLSTSERELQKLKDTLTTSASYGDGNVLYALRDKCFETSGGQYVYRMCFFGKAAQDSTSLGEMQPFDASRTPLEVSFSGGTSCWNGPARSLRVTLECGATAELYGVDEPSTCVYAAKLKTPVACDEAYKTRLLGGENASTTSHQTPHHIEIAVDATAL